MHSGSRVQKEISSAVHRNDQKLHQIVAAVMATYSTARIRLWQKLDRGTYSVINERPTLEHLLTEVAVVRPGYWWTTCTDYMATS